MSPIKASEIDRFVREEGEYVRHFIGMRCYCRDESGHFDPNCTEHDLTGSIYREEREIIGLITAITQHKEILAAGIAFPGDCVFSPESEIDVSPGDKVIFTWEQPFGEGDSLIRGNEDEDALTYRATSAIYCGDEDGNRYKEGVDFRFDGKAIQWQWAEKLEEASEPLIGKRYVVKYRGFIEWIAFDIPQDRVSHGVDIGAKVLLRKLHIVRGQS